MALSQEIFEKLKILTDAAKYDVACTSSGSSRSGGNDTMGNTVSGGICHCFAADGRCISLLKILQTNECVYDCRYCCNRRSRDVPRATFSPEEIAELTISFYRRNYIEGLFLSSGINRNPDYTMEQIYQAVYLLRTKYKFNGYIHVKAIPGADPLLIEKTGWIVDRMSVNMELPTADGLRELAPQKSRRKIFTPMRQIQLGRKENYLIEAYEQRRIGYVDHPSVIQESRRKQPYQPVHLPNLTEHVSGALQESHPGKSFVPAGQSTQMIIGATDETDYQIVHMAEAMYQQFDLKRVFYSAFINTTHDDTLPDTTENKPQLLREHRLYQADFLLRFYHFKAEEIITAEHPNLNVQIDPKCNWALNHMECFPVEVEKATYHTLLRVPGIGVKSAKRIVAARRMGSLDYSSLKKIGVVLKRAMYFITCHGKMMMPIQLNPSFILTNLLGLDEKILIGATESSTYKQMTWKDMDGGFL